jgi:hypothetical protein
VSSFLIGIVFAKNLSQEDNTPPSFYTKDFTLPMRHTSDNIA